MSGTSQLEFYRARVAQSRADAEAATLDHVRERCLRSQAACQAMADRAGRSDEFREKALLEKRGGQPA